MKSQYTVPTSLILVVLAHVGILAAILLAPKEAPAIFIEPPTIKGVIIASEPIETPPELAPPPPPKEVKPLPQPKIPLPKAPPSERAIKEEVVEPRPVEAPAPIDEPKVAEPAPVSLPRADANHLNNPAPAYPPASRRLREEGVVLLEILVKADGTLGEMRLKKSSGFDRLDDAAQRAVKNWHFVPATRGDEAIDYWYELPVEFSLNH